jgi:hypothetical protein
MQIPLLRSLSGRIILGFTVVVLTFAGVSGLINYYMGVLSREIRLIRTTYLPLAMETKNLSEKQQALWEYLSDDLVNAGSRRHAEQLTIKYKAARLKLLRDTEGILENLNDVPGRHRRFLRPTVTRIRQIRVLVDAQEPLYKTLLEEPPLASLRDTAQPADSAPPRQRPVNWVAYRKAVEALDLLRANEADIRVKAQTSAKKRSEPPSPWSGTSAGCACSRSTWA